ncbi:hypothetical protein PARA125_000734 [Parachlamydia sp. AcF125]|nr:hypothetical protein [Parachlamydia sp. AcF125]
MSERNWKQYNKQLIQRGSLTFLLEPKLLKPTVKRQPTKGRPYEYSNVFVEILFMLKIQFKLAYRALQGFAQSFLAKLLPCNKIPSYTLICKCVQKLGKTLPKLSLTTEQSPLIHQEDESGRRRRMESKNA